MSQLFFLAFVMFIIICYFTCNSVPCSSYWVHCKLCVRETRVTCVRVTEYKRKRGICMLLMCRTEYYCWEIKCSTMRQSECNIIDIQSKLRLKQPQPKENKRSRNRNTARTDDRHPWPWGKNIYIYTRSQRAPLGSRAPPGLLVPHQCASSKSTCFARHAPIVIISVWQHFGKDPTEK